MILYGMTALKEKFSSSCPHPRDADSPNDSEAPNGSQVLNTNLTALESTLTKKRPATLLQSTLTKTLDLKSFRMNTYKKRGGGGGGSPRILCRALVPPNFA